MTFIILLAKIGASVLIGMLIGIIHFKLLRLNVNWYLAEGVRGRIVAVHALRFLVLALAFFVIARVGAIALLSAFAGLLVARSGATSVLVRQR